MFDRQINKPADIRDFIEYLIEVESLNFHPDTDFGDYVSNDSGEPCFTQEQSAHYNKLMARSFRICEQESVDIYLYYEFTS